MDRKQALVVTTDDVVLDLSIDTRVLAGGKHVGNAGARQGVFREGGYIAGALKLRWVVIDVND